MNKKSKQNKFSQVESLSNREKMLRGTAWLSAGLMLSRIIGALYIIFWARWIGEHYEIANSLFSLAYVPYVLFLDIATAGFPLAITKQISQLNSKNEYKASFTLFKNSLFVMIGLGIVSALVFYFSAEAITGFSGVLPTKDPYDNVRVLRSLTPALLILPSISLLRGFFQGFQQMTTPAISQIIEQFVRVAYMLGMTFYIMRVQNGSLVDAVYQSTFAAFVGALVSLLFLVYELIKGYPYIRHKMAEGIQTKMISLKDTIKIVLHDAMPFVFVSAGTSMLSLIDQFSYNTVIREFYQFTQHRIAVSYAWFSSNAAKLVGIVGTIASALSTASIPNIASAYHNANKKELSNAATNNIKLFTFLIIPCSVGMYVISTSIYKVFYGDANGAHVLRVYCLYLIATGIFSVFISTLQGMGKHGIAIKSLSILLLSKLTFNFIFIALFKEQGPGLASISAASLAAYYLYHELYAIAHFDKKSIFENLLQTLNCTSLMAGSALLTHMIGNFLLPEFGFVPNVIRVALTILVGGLVYIYSALSSGLAEKNMPGQALRLKRLFKIK